MKYAIKLDETGWEIVDTMLGAELLIGKPSNAYESQILTKTYYAYNQLKNKLATPAETQHLTHEEISIILMHTDKFRQQLPKNRPDLRSLFDQLYDEIGNQRV